MGCGGSKEFDSEAKQRNDQIDSQLRKDKVLLRNEIKMLLLGAGESGKSTILKQMKLIHEGSYTSDERESYKEIIFSNTVQSMLVILDAMEMMRIPFHNHNISPSSAHAIRSFNHSLESDPQYYNQFERLDPRVVDAIEQLWCDGGVRTCFDRSREYQLNDSAGYYFDSIRRIGQPDYIPDDQDVLRSRVKTTGITETVFLIGELRYRMFDVGGQRSERKKWIHCFENVTAIVFLVAVSEYDQTLYEDETVNRMQEALNLFDSICNSRWFIRTSIILFLNKIDLFKQKLLQGSRIEDFFPEFKAFRMQANSGSINSSGQRSQILSNSQNSNQYGGGGTPNSNHDQHLERLLQAGADFFSQKFVAMNQSPNKQVYVHLTCATDTSQIRFVLSAVNDIIIQINLRECGLL